MSIETTRARFGYLAELVAGTGGSLDVRFLGKTVPVPHGLAFSPDESVLYVTDTAGPDHGVPLRIASYEVLGGVCKRRAPAVELGEGHAADGLRVDVQGRIWTSAGSAVRVYSPSFELLDTIEVPEKVSNVCFGGPDGQDLYITATTSLYRIRTTTRDTAARLTTPADNR